VCGECFAISNKVIRRRLAAVGKNTSVGPDSVSGDILNLGGEAMFPNSARLLDINNTTSTILSDWKEP
jgi:hypothetical protein